MLKTIATAIGTVVGAAMAAMGDAALDAIERDRGASTPTGYYDSATGCGSCGMCIPRTAIKCPWCHERPR